jgi:hypothetical protein
MEDVLFESCGAGKEDTVTSYFMLLGSELSYAKTVNKAANATVRSWPVLDA